MVASGGKGVGSAVAPNEVRASFGGDGHRRADMMFVQVLTCSRLLTLLASFVRVNKIFREGT